LKTAKAWKQKHRLAAEAVINVKEHVGDVRMPVTSRVCDLSFA